MAHLYLANQVPFFSWEHCVVERDVSEAGVARGRVVDELMQFLDDQVDYLFLFFVHQEVAQDGVVFMLHLWTKKPPHSDRKLCKQSLYLL